jgi:carbohydrate diacid regulator
VEDLLRDLAHYDPEITEPDLIAFKAHELGYDLRLRRCAVVIDVAVEAVAPRLPESPSPSEPATLRSAILRTLRQAFPNPRDLIGTAASGRFVVLLHLCGDDAIANLLARCREIAHDLVRPHSCRIGVGGIATSVAQLHDSYRDATTALYLANRLGRSERVTHIADVRTHDLLATVAHGTRARFAADMIGTLREQPGWVVTRKTITAWCESGFNLVQASAALHIHRNTLVYRLGKIEAVAGQSFREPRTCLAVYLACLIDELEDSS